MATAIIRNVSQREITLQIGDHVIQIQPESAVPPVSGMASIDDSVLAEGMKYQAIKGLFDAGDLEVVSKPAARSKKAQAEDDQ